MRTLRTIVTTALFSWFVGTNGSAQAVDINAQRQLVNRGVLGVLCDDVRGTHIEMMGELATVLDDGYDMRIMPMAGKGSVRAIEDLLLLRGVDIALVQADVLNFYKEVDIFPEIDKRLSYIAKLYDAELHILASKDIRSIKDLRGKKVNFGPPSSGSYITASQVFERLHIFVDARDDDYQIALDKLRQGEIAAWVRVAAKPMLDMDSMPDWEGVHFLSVPPSLIEDVYVGAQLTSDDYPNLIDDDETVETIAVGTVMAVYNWSRSNPKRGHLQEFARRFVASTGRLRHAPFHPKWREVDLTETVPGWRRF